MSGHPSLIGPGFTALPKERRRAGEPCAIASNRSEMKIDANGKLKLSEADVTLQIRGFLEAKNWRIIRFQRTVVPGQFSTHEPGTPDLAGIFYVKDQSIPGAAVVLWIEMKKKDARPQCRCATKKARQRCTACDQAAWRQRERARGAVVWTVDSIEWFTRAYDSTFGYLHQGDVVGQLEFQL